MGIRPDSARDSDQIAPGMNQGWGDSHDIGCNKATPDSAYTSE